MQHVSLMTLELTRITVTEVEDILQGRSKGRAAAEAMDRWRSYFRKAGADVWTIIEQAIILAATDHAKDFKAKRSEIAETLFARRLLHLRSGDTDVTRLSGSVVTNATNATVENEVRNNEEGTRVTWSERERPQCSYQEADALTDEIEEERHLLKELYSIKETIADSDQSESTILDSLQRLEHMQITVKALKATEIGKQVNCLRKHSSKEVRAIVKQLVRKWRDLVDEWVKTSEDMTAAAVVGSKASSILEPGNEVQRLLSPPLDKVALLAGRTSPSEMSQPFSFMDEERCGQASSKGEELSMSVEPSIRDNLYFPSKSQSGSILSDYSDYDAKASTSHNWGFRVPEERASTNRDIHFSGRIERKLESSSRGSASEFGTDCEQLNLVGGLCVSKSVKGSSGPGRPSNDATKANIASGPVTVRSFNDLSKVNRSHDFQRNAGLDVSSGDKSSKPSTLNNSNTIDKSLNAQKLEIAKRKLHEGYQQAENAKKQRTVQRVDLPDLPKVAQMRGKLNPPVQNKTASQTGLWSQNRRNG